MTEPNFNFEIVDVPAAIREKMMDLASSVNITKRSRKGASSWLFFGQNKVHNQHVAIKFYDWGGDKQYHAEPKYLTEVTAENVIPILDAGLVDSDYAYFQTPFYANGDLDEEIRQGVRGNVRAIQVIRDILSGLGYLHSANLLHRDLKAENILIADDGKAIIGDFGSVKLLPEGKKTVPGSGHSLIYRPPESVLNGKYGFSGDIYQVGVLLYQLLGGFLPYEASMWLKKGQLERYRKIKDHVDQQIYGDTCIKERIMKGKIVDVSSLPEWVCKPLRRTVKKACALDKTKRYQSCADFLARLNDIRQDVHDWRIEGGILRRYGTVTYQVVKETRKVGYSVSKDKGLGFRRDRSLSGTELSEVIAAIEKQESYT